jgi:hypothetical protein
MGLKSVASRSSSVLPHPYKILSKSTNRFISCNHLRSLNIHHFGMIEVTFKAITTTQNYIQIHQSVQKVYPPLKFKLLPLWKS